jgi:hypothetical protein
MSQCTECVCGSTYYKAVRGGGGVERGGHVLRVCQVSFSVTGLFYGSLRL